MKARDKALATTAWLRDNAIVGMPGHAGRPLAGATEGAWLAGELG
jgi:hypothetical protein